MRLASHHPVHHFQENSGVNTQDLLVVDNLSIYYGCCGVIENLSFSVKKGSIVSVVGGNGSGKSTFLKTLAGMHAHFCGAFSWNVTCTSGRAIGYLPQHADVHRYLPIHVQDVVYMGAQVRKADRSVVEQALLAVGLEDKAKTEICTLSGGQFQRMLFARLLAMDPDIFLLDEPFTSIDEASQNILIQQLFTQSKQGKTFFLAHHQGAIVTPYCTHTLHLFHGRHCWVNS